MAYSSLADVQEQLSEAELVGLTDDEGIGAVDTAAVIRSIEDADQEIDGYIGARARVPLDPVPGIIRKISVDIALYNLYSRRRDTCPETRAERYKNALKFLTMAADGKVSLGQTDPDGNPPEKGGIAVKAADQVMTVETLGRF